MKNVIHKIVTKNHLSYLCQKEIVFLQYVRTLLLNKGWVRKDLAQNEKGEPVSPHSSDACSFCLTGAFFRAELDLQASMKTRFGADRLLTSIIEKKMDPSFASRLNFSIHHYIPVYNDEEAKDVSDIISIVDEAILVGQMKRY